MPDPAPGDGSGEGQFLDHVTVADFSMVGPGPRCTRILADYGARVVKIRPPATADLLEAPTYAYSGDRGIERIQVDLKAPAGREVVERLLGLATVVVESFRPGVAARLGIGYEQVSARRPDVVYCSISGYGQAPPAAGYPGHDLNYLGVAGYLGLCGRDPAGLPAMPGASIADAAGGFAAATAILAALSGRPADQERGAGRRRGAYLDVSITDATLRFTQMFVDQYLTTGVEPVHGSDQLLGGRACYGVYETGDGRWMTLGALEPRFWRRFCGLAGLEDLVDHQHDEAAQARLRAAVAGRLQERPLAEWLELLATEVPVGPVNRIAEVAEEPRLSGGRAVWEVPTDDGRQLRQLAPHLAGTVAEPPPGTVVPAPGRTHTEAFLKELGYGAAEMETMKKEGVVPVKLETVYHEDRVKWGKPLDGVTVLAAEHMQALPFATQLLAGLGARVVKVEPPGGEAGRGARPRVPEPDGSTVGGTFARNNLSKSSIVLDLKNEVGRTTFLELAKEVDVVAENMRPGVMDRLGLSYEAVSAVAPQVVYVSVSGFGNRTPSPYREWPAYAPVAEAMSGLYEISRDGDGPPPSVVAGALGDISAALFAALGTVAALRHRDRMGAGQHVDVSMFDAMVAMNDMAPQLWSLGLPAGMAGGQGTGIMRTFRAKDGYFLVAVLREHQLERLAQAIGRPEWPNDPRLADRGAWSEHVEDVFRPALESWAASRSRLEVVEALAAVGVPSGPCFTMDDLAVDDHVDGHNMLVEIPTSPDTTMLMAGNPIKLSKMAEGPLHRYPNPGQHTDQELGDLLGLSAAELADRRRAGAFGPPAG